jgi:hypothetical protein
MRKMNKPYHLNIRSGVHRAASIKLDDGVYTVGRSIDNDIVLSDPGIADLQVEIHVSGAEVSVKPLGDQVVVADAMAPSGALTKWDSGTVKIADVELDLKRPQMPTQSPLVRGRLNEHRRFVSVAVGASLASVFVICATAITDSSSTAPALLAQSGPMAQASLHAKAAREAANISALAQKIGSEPAWQKLKISGEAAAGYEVDGIVPRSDDLNKLRSYIALNNLRVDSSRVEVGERLVEHANNFLRDPSLQVSYDPSSGLNITGQRTFSSSVQRVKLLRNELGQRVEVSDVTSHKSDKKDKRVVLVKLPLALVAVDAVKGYVEGDDGTKYFPGSKLSNGFVIERVTAKAVYLTANGQPVVYELN